LKLGRYEVVRELGKGAMGIVYLGRDPVIGRMVALKTIRQTKNPDDEVKEFHQRFVREAQAAGVLSHPAIVTVHDIGEDTESGTHFIAMEYVEGPNLKEILSQGTALTFEQVASVISQVAEALDYAHTKGIVHRDVKPANIIWCGDSKVKITDFGIAKIASSANLTSTGQFLGTPNYMAPEQIKGAPVDGRSDIFSLGIVLYECLTRKKPFGGDSLTTISYRIVHEPFPRLRDVNSSIPVEFEEIVQRCLEKNPSNRYQRGLEVSRALSAIGRATKGFSSAVPPLLADETILTRQDVDRERIATVEMPFPEMDTELALVAEPPRLKVRKFPVPIATGPMLARKIPAPVFWGASLLLLFAVGIFAAKILSARVKVPPVDTRRETLVARQRALRNEGNELVRAQNVEGAYQKFLQLAQIAPASQWVRSMLTKLDSVRGEESDRKQRKADALVKIEEGKQLMGKKDYAGATVLFGEAFGLDPDSDEATELLKAAQVEHQKELEAQEQKLVLGGRTLTSAIKPRAVTAPPPKTYGSVVAPTLAFLDTRFDSPVADGYLLVKVDGETMVYQNVWEEKGRLRRKTPKSVRVRSEVRPRSSEIVVYLVIPSLKYQDSSVLRVAFRAGTAHVLTVKFNPRTRMMEASVS